MPHVTVATENDAPIDIYFEDHGSGQPMVLIHGYPQNGNSRERHQWALLANSGYIWDIGISVARVWIAFLASAVMSAKPGTP